MNDTEIIAQIHQHEDRLVAAQLAHDVAELDALIHDDLLFHGPGGTVETKAADLEAHRSGLYVINRLEHLERQFRVLSEDVVLASVLAEAEGSAGETPIKGKLRYLRVWQRFEEGWKIVGGSLVGVI